MSSSTTNYFESDEDLKTLTENCTYISLPHVHIALTDKGNIFLKFNAKQKQGNDKVVKVLKYLLEEGWKLKRNCNVFLY